jgi:hypothetical protein
MSTTAGATGGGGGAFKIRSAADTGTARLVKLSKPANPIARMLRRMVHPWFYSIKPYPAPNVPRKPSMSSFPYKNLKLGQRGISATGGALHSVENRSERVKPKPLAGYGTLMFPVASLNAQWLRGEGSVVGVSVIRRSWYQT